MLTDLMRNRPAVGYSLALVIGAVVALVGIGGAVAGSDRAGAALFMGLIGVIGLLVIASLLLELLQRSRRPHAELAQTSSGERATVFRFGPASFLPVVGTLVAFAAAAVWGLVLALGSDESGWTVVCAIVAVGSLVYLAPVLLGRVRPGGVYLTPQGVEHRRLGTSWRLAWDEIEGVVPREPLPVLPRGGVRPHRDRTSPYGWKGDVRASEGVLGISTRHLPVDEKTLAFLLASYLEHPEMRTQLGTDASLDWKILVPGS